MTTADDTRADYDAFVDRRSDETLLAWLLSLRAHFASVATLGLPTDADRAEMPIGTTFIRPWVSWTEPGQQKPRRLQEAELLVAARKRVVLLGESGSGKSALATWLTWTLAERSRNAVHKRIGTLVPLPFVLRDLPVTDETRTWEALVDLLRGQPVWTSGLDAILPRMAQAGQLLVIVDGWDEVGDTSLRRALRDALRDGMRRFPRSSFLLTSRPLGYDEVPLDDRLGPGSLDILEARIEPLDDAQVRQFIQAWTGWRRPTEASQRAQALVTQLEADPDLLALARNPQLLAMLALVQGRARRLPAGRAELYARVVDAYLEEAEDAPTRARTPRATRRRWLQELAILMNRRRTWGASAADLAEFRTASPDAAAGVERLQSGTVIERAAAEERLLRKAVPGRRGESPDDVRAFLDASVRRSGLLVPRSPTRIAFTHLSVQDWLAAGAYVERLRGGWANRRRAEQAATELERSVLRAAGGETVVFTLDLLRLEQPDLAEALGDQVFGERAAHYRQHARLAQAHREIVRSRDGHKDEEGVDWFVPVRALLDATALRDLNSLDSLSDLLTGPSTDAGAAPWGLGLRFDEDSQGLVDDLRARLPDLFAHLRVVELHGCHQLARFDDLPHLAAIYIMGCPAVSTLASLSGGPRRAAAASAPTGGPTRTIYLQDSNIDRIPPRLGWRVVDEHGLCYTPEDGIIRQPHTPV